MSLIAHVDMDAFFASIEQRDNPELQGKPTIVCANQYSNIIIAASYEAKRLGYKVGDKITKKDPVLICYSKHKHYQAISKIIMACLYDITPDIEIYSIDEAFLDLSGIAQHYSSELSIIKAIKQAIYKATQLPCSIGLAPNKPLAKMASSENKPNGHFIVHPDQVLTYLHQKPIQDLCGIGNKMQQFLNQQGIYTCDQMKNIPISFLSNRFGQLGRQIWYACQGIGSSQLKKTSFPKSMGHSKRVAHRPYQLTEVHQVFNLLNRKLCQRLRGQKLKARQLSITIHTSERRYQQKFKLHSPTHQYQSLSQLYIGLLNQLPWPLTIHQISIRVTDLTPHSQMDWLDTTPDVDSLMDKINEQYADSIQYGLDTTR